jgi:hypothetical protein
MNYKLTVENDIALVCSKQNSSVDLRALWTNYAESFSNMIFPRLEGVENSDIFLQKRDSIRYEIYNWLKSWHTNDQIIKPLGKSKNANNKFNNYTDDSSSDDEKEPNIFVIEGSYSSGKTTLVHSFGIENDINIIEINAGQLRSGATIKKLISEATQSYGINHLNKENNFGGVSMIFFDEVLSIYYLLFTIYYAKYNILYNKLLCCDVRSTFVSTKTKPSIQPSIRSPSPHDVLSSSLQKKKSNS